MFLYRFAPYILGVAGTIAGLIGYIFGEIIPMKVDNFLWISIMLTHGLGGVYCGLLLRKLNRDSNTDLLTKLWNRRYLRNKLTEEIGRVQRYERPLCVAMIDVDDFKQVNDTYGHTIGDELLIEIAEVFQLNTRKVDTVARWGGDEFFIVLPETNIEGAVAVLERIRTTVELILPNWHVSLSIGITMLHPNMNLKKAFEAADKALYKAKQTKNIVIVG